MHRFHLGVDFGTSASKLILRHFEAAGGERAYLLEPKNRFRIPSAVSFEGRDIILHSDRDDALVSLKMRYAGEVTGNLGRHFYGDAKEIPWGVSARDLVTLTIWKLISVGHLSTVNILGHTDFKMGMTLGVPMSFLDDEDLRIAFLDVARTAYQMYREFGPLGPDRIEVQLGMELLRLARSQVENKPPISRTNIRNWIRSETEASMFWSFRSPATGRECFFCIDIGAGTTDASAFLINEDFRDDQWVKAGMCFFGAHSHPYAMDALGAAIDFDEACQRIRDGLVNAGRNAYRLLKDNGVSVNQWGKPKLIILGGGVFNKSLCEVLKWHPMVNFRQTVLDRLDLDVPPDLFRTNESKVKSEDVAFTSVAYGLAQIGEAVPEAARPNQVQPVRAHAIRTLPTHDEIYGD